MSYDGKVQQLLETAADYTAVTASFNLESTLHAQVCKSSLDTAKQAIENGANEIDMVVNLGWVQEGDYDSVLKEISQIRAATEGKILKVIVETCFLTQEQKIKLCEVVTQSGADFIKTSTGFGGGGATREDIELFSRHIGKNVKMKAAGGIKNLKDAEDFINLGCERLGTSSIVKAVKEL